MPSLKRPDKISLAALCIALLSVAMHLGVNYVTPYEIHRDEFLYFAMGEHFRLWQMDFPPLIALASIYSRAWFGDSLPALRFFPALAGGLLILVAVDAARRLGGKSFAQVFTALSMLASALFLRTASLFQPVIFDQLWWTLGLWCLLRWRQSGKNAWWLGLGIVMGLGLFTKFSILFFGFGVLVGLLATSERRLLLTRWPWIAFALTVLIGLPSIVGQFNLGFPVKGQIQDLRTVQLVHVSYVDFLTGQLMMLGVSAFVVITGIIALLFSKRYSSYRILGWTFIGSFAALLFTHGKAYYIGPIYPVLIAAGAVMFEQVGSGRSSVYFRRLTIAVVVLLGAAIVPMGLPVLSPVQMEHYSRMSSVTPAEKTNTGTEIRLPQDYADMLGWQDRVAKLAMIFSSLTPAQRADAVIIAGNYGEAGAVDFYGPRYGLPHALCVSGSYWFFGPGPKPGRVAITIGIKEQDLKKNWRRVTAVAQLKNEWTVPEEQDITYYRCEDEVQSMQALWHLFAGRN